MLQFWQKLQHYLERNFNLEHGPAATIIISLLVFFLGFFIKGVINWIGKLKERWTVRHLFIDNLKGLRDQIEIQKNGFTETAKSLDMQSNTVWAFHRTTFFQVSVFSEMKYSDTFRAYFLGLENAFVFLRGKDFRIKRRQAFYKVWENNNNLEFWSDKIINDFHNYLEKYNALQDSWNEAVTELRLTWVDFFYKRMNKELPDKELEFTVKLQKILLDYNAETHNESEAIKPYNVHTRLVRPIKSLSENYERFVDVRQLIETSLKSVNAYIELDTFVSNVRGQMEEYSDMMNKMLDSATKAVNILSKGFP